MFPIQQADVPQTSPAVLVVEDEYDIRQALHLLLELEGYRVLEAANGREALRVLDNSEAVGVVLLDMMMPVMNGWQFLEAISNRSLPVIVVSARSEPISGVNVKAQIGKPISVDTLVKEIRKWVTTP